MILYAKLRNATNERCQINFTLTFVHGVYRLKQHYLIKEPDCLNINTRSGRLSSLNNGGEWLFNAGCLQNSLYRVVSWEKNTMITLRKLVTYALNKSMKIGTDCTMGRKQKIVRSIQKHVPIDNLETAFLMDWKRILKYRQQRRFNA